MLVLCNCQPLGFAGGQAVSRPRSTLSGQRSTVNCQLSTVNCQLSFDARTM
ncbi:hypothetical protein Q5689_06865 [Microcoleus sp. ARI1-A2]|uniref:hypothetical protein n=1 Tax=Microcoleus sp. ARI1-A2 TaxID=2818557 RepID=UPI002FCFBF80